MLTQVKPFSDTPKKTLHQRGIHQAALEYRMRDPSTGRVSHHEMMVPSDMKILPQHQVIYDDTLKIMPSFRERIGNQSHGHFVLIDPQRKIVVGLVSFDMRKLSDADLAWINCLFAECEGAVLALAVAL